ncbi:MAG: DNA alkylation repair protein [Prolixibacteraceae bacterium]|nr:DNA alkylation repair protein [Prolixibacteraceae bacterium]
MNGIYLKNMDNILKMIRKELKDKANGTTRESGQRFFKEEVKIYGVKTAVVRRTGKKFFQNIKGKAKEEIFSLCEELWKSGYLEESFIACDWSYALHKLYEPEDFNIFERWIDSYVQNWAACDTFCNHTMGEFIEMYPEYLSGLKQFAASDNRWMRRASAVSLIIPARKGMFLDDIMEIAGSLLLDRDDMVQKGYGWLLKVASQAHQKKIFEYVMSKKSAMPRTALRYAIEKMPPEMKKAAMAK